MALLGLQDLPPTRDLAYCPFLSQLSFPIRLDLILRDVNNNISDASPILAFWLLVHLIIINCHGHILDHVMTNNWKSSIISISAIPTITYHFSKSLSYPTPCSFRATLLQLLCILQVLRKHQVFSTLQHSSRCYSLCLGPLLSALLLLNFKIILVLPWKI